jgi:hypothetical protein
MHDEHEHHPSSFHHLYANELWLARWLRDLRFPPRYSHWRTEDYTGLLDIQASLLCKLGEPEWAAACWDKMAAMYRDAGQRRDQCRIFYRIACSWLDHGEAKRAVPVLKEAVARLREVAGVPAKTKASSVVKSLAAQHSPQQEPVRKAAINF